VAKKIRVLNKYVWIFRTSTGQLYQYDSGHNRNFIISFGTDADQSDGVRLQGQLYVTDETNPNGALIYSANDFVTLDSVARIDMKGCIIAQHNLNLWDFVTSLDYTYSLVRPDGLMSAAGAASFEIVSWNK